MKETKMMIRVGCCCYFRLNREELPLGDLMFLFNQIKGKEKSQKYICTNIEQKFFTFFTQLSIKVKNSTNPKFLLSTGGHPNPCKSDLKVYITLLL